MLGASSLDDFLHQLSLGVILSNLQQQLLVELNLGVRPTVLQQILNHLMML